MQARSRPRKQSGRPRTPRADRRRHTPHIRRNPARKRPNTAEYGKWPKVADFFSKVRISAQKCALRPCRRGRGLASNQAAPDPPSRPAAPHRPHPPQSGQKTAESGRLLLKSAHKCAKKSAHAGAVEASQAIRQTQVRPSRPAALHRPHPPQSGQKTAEWPKVADFFSKVRISAQKCALRPCRRGQGLASNQANPGPPRRPAAPHRPHPPQSGQKTAEYGQKWPKVADFFSKVRISAQKCALRSCRRGRGLASNQASPDPPSRPALARPRDPVKEAQCGRRRNDVRSQVGKFRGAAADDRRALAPGHGGAARDRPRGRPGRLRSRAARRPRRHLRRRAEEDARRLRLSAAAQTLGQSRLLRRAQICPTLEELLEGTGAKMRHVKIRTLQDTERAAVPALIRAALAHRKGKTGP